MDAQEAHHGQSLQDQGAWSEPFQVGENAEWKASAFHLQPFLDRDVIDLRII